MIRLEKIGFDLLTETTKEQFDKIFAEHSGKIERRLKDVEYCRVMLKEYGQGKRTKFSIHVLVSYAGKTVEADATEWDLRKTVHIAFNRIEQEIEHMFHVSDMKKHRENR